MTSSISSTAYGLSYVIADNPNEAYKIVRSYLDKRDLGFVRERALESIEFLAETGDYPECLTQLFIAYPSSSRNCGPQEG
ncbi:MAG: hypothetical protein SVK08_00640 [Halobacteriota archaeon]|nr:hypothetical protein [Halobacteriota archaeon]